MLLVPILCIDVGHVLMSGGWVMRGTVPLHSSSARFALGRPGRLGRNNLDDASEELLRSSAASHLKLSLYL